VADLERQHDSAGPHEREPAAACRPYLLVVSGPQFGELLDLEPGAEVVLGRGADSGFLAADDGISRRHASLLARADEALLRDLESQNGTWVDGARIAVAPLRDGQCFSLGSHTSLRFVGADHPEAELQRRLAQGALREPLTGLYSRRHFLERLTAELAASQRHGRPLSLLLIDLDHLKRINEAHGLGGGDEVLRSVARVVQGAVRKEEVVARYGSEELAVLVRDTGLSGARVLAERIRKAVHKARAAHQGREIAVTVSLGVTVSQGLTAFEPGRTEQQILEAAERALLRAKQMGRNTVVAAPAAGS